MSKYIKLEKIEEYGKYSLRGYRGNKKFFVVVIACDKAGNYLQISKLKIKNVRSISSAFISAKRQIAGWSPPKPISVGLSLYSAYHYEFFRLLKAEKSHFEGMDRFYLNGFNSYNWPHLIIQDRYAPVPSIIDDADDEYDDCDEELSKNQLKEIDSLL
jgi:hypothetical protein